MRQALFHCPELYDKVRAPRARHYHRIDDHWTLMIVQDSRKHFTLHAVVEKDEDMARLFEAIVGTPVKYEMVHCANGCSGCCWPSIISRVASSSPEMRHIL
jgi:hypothetical protein